MTAPAHVLHAPALQVCVPRRQMPISELGPHACTSDSSIRASQSSSRPLQLSVVGAIRPLHAPHRPALQVWVPVAHSPVSTPSGHARVAPVVHAHPSSTPIEQFSSSVP